MPSLFRMPTPAAGVEEATLLEWSVDERASFAESDVLFVIETDKAVIDVEAEADGVLHRKLVGGGRSVEVGTPVAVIGAAGDSEADIDALVNEAGVAAGAGGSDGARADSSAEPVAAESAATSSTGSEPAAPEPVVSPDIYDASAADGRAAEAEAAGPGGAEASADHGARLFASPIARQMAKNAGLDLEALTGTGPGGRIVRRDVTAAIESGPAGAGASGGARPGASMSAAGAAAGGVIAGSKTDAERGYTDQPHTRIRRAIATRLTESKQQVPHFYVQATVRVDALLGLRAELNAGGGPKISVNDLVVRAAACAHRQMPEMNVTYLPDATRHFDYVDVAVAVATDGGLVTPVLRDVDRMPIGVVAATTVDFAQRARAGRLRQHELEGGSITVTNLGMFGTEEFAAIINPPHAAILAVGAARREPVVQDGPDGEELAIGTVAHLVLSVDHRAVDGVIAAQWMRALTELIEHPIRVLV